MSERFAISALSQLTYPHRLMADYARKAILAHGTYETEE